MGAAKRVVARPPGPKVGLGRAFLTLRRDPLKFLMETAARYGDIAYFRAGPYDIYELSHPDLIREVLVTHPHDVMKSQGLQETKRILGEGLLTSEGDFHKRQRRLIQPLFHHQRIDAYGRAMAEIAERFAEEWRDGQTLDVHQEMMRLTLAIVGGTLFGTDVDEEQAREVGQAMSTALGMFDRFMLPFAAYLERLPLPSIRRFERAKQTLNDVVYGMIRERRATGDRGDLLSMLLAAQDEEGGGRMSDTQVRDEAMTIFLAGHETTANALTWTWYLLSQHPDVEAKLHEEIDGALDGRAPTPADAQNLRYTEMVLAEAMRLYPPAWVVGRRALVDIELTGWTIPADATCLMSQYVVHHDARWYPDPERFDPERWAPEVAALRPKFAYFPFGGGSRLCIGESFAWMEGILLIATLARRWRMRLVPGHPIALQPRVTLRPAHGMRMRLEGRLLESPLGH